MRTYRYYAELSDGKHTILWKERSTNIKNFISKMEKKFKNSEWKISKCGKCPPKSKREKRYFSMAFVDMGQAARY